MLNLTEKHVVVVLVLIAIIFLLFLSTRTPICNKETFNGLNHYSQENNDLYMSNKKISDITDIIESNKENPLLLTKSDMADLKGSYDLNNNSSVVDIFTNSYEADINNKIPEYANLTEEDTSNTETSKTDTSNIDVEDNMLNEVIQPKKDDEPVLNDKPFDYANNCSDNVVMEEDHILDGDAPIGHDTNFNYSPFGLLEDDMKSFIPIKNNPKLDDSKCVVLRDALLDLNKTGYIENNRVESSWNNTFKDTCGNW
jgi:hypothetical protein